MLTKVARESNHQAGSELLEAISKLIADGRVQLAKAKLRNLLTHKIPPHLLLSAASLARRANLPTLAVRLLNPIVRPGARSAHKATNEEKAEYAASLVAIGASKEAFEVLRTANPEKEPRIFLYRAFALTSQWNYGEAVPILKDFVRSPKLDDYLKCVGKLNLAAALIAERWFEEARPILKELMEETKAKGFVRLQGNLLELESQIEIRSGDLEKAKKYLGEAEIILAETGGLDLMFVRKWQAICEAAKSGSRKPLHAVRGEAVLARHWETVRDCDWHEAALFHDQKLLLQVYFGTPHRAYRERVFREYPKPVVIPAFYDWNLTAKKGREILDLSTGKYDGNKTPLSPGTSLHALINILGSDFYRPFRVATLHALLYPTEYFSPTHSPNRVHQLITRLRRTLLSAKIPLDIVEDGNGYKLASKMLQLRVPKSFSQHKRQDILLKEICDANKNGTFTAKKVCLEFQTTLRTTLRLLKYGIEKGLIESQGKGNAIRYSVK